MSFSVDLSNELHLKNVEDEARLQLEPQPQLEPQQETEPKFVFFDTQESELFSKRTNNDSENSRQLISHLNSHTSGMAMEKSEGSEEDLY